MLAEYGLGNLGLRSTAQCCADYARQHSDDANSVRGRIICCNGRAVPCPFWDDAGTEISALASPCTIIHESVHVRDRGTRSCTEGEVCGIPDLDASECRAYTAEAPCLESALQQCSSDHCRSTIQGHLNFIYSDYAPEFCGKAGMPRPQRGALPQITSRPPVIEGGIDRVVLPPVQLEPQQPVIEGGPGYEVLPPVELHPIIPLAEDTVLTSQTAMAGLGAARARIAQRQQPQPSVQSSSGILGSLSQFIIPVAAGVAVGVGTRSAAVGVAVGAGIFGALKIIPSLTGNKISTEPSGVDSQGLQIPGY